MTFTVDFGSHVLTVNLDPENPNVIRESVVSNSSRMDSFEIVGGKREMADFCQLRLIDLVELFGGGRFRPEELEEEGEAEDFEKVIPLFGRTSHRGKK